MYYIFMAKASRRSVPRREAPPAAPSALAAAERPYRLTDFPMHYFAAIQRQNQLNLGRSLREHGLTVPMWRAMSALHQKDGQTIGEIAQLAVLDRSSLGRLLDDMAKEGLVEREPLPDDRRALAIKLSAAGRRKFEAGLPLVQRHYQNVLKGVSADEFETLMRVLRRIKANARMMSDVSDLETD
jgi:MarR family transcriptional regulator, organic hydroperoxide resistance regulator